MYNASISYSPFISHWISIHQQRFQHRSQRCLRYVASSPLGLSHHQNGSISTFSTSNTGTQSTRWCSLLLFWHLISCSNDNHTPAADPWSLITSPQPGREDATKDWMNGSTGSMLREQGHLVQWKSSTFTWGGGGGGGVVISFFILLSLFHNHFINILPNFWPIEYQYLPEFNRRKILDCWL